MGEAAKISARIMKESDGLSVLDLGCGDSKVVPWAIGVDDGSEWADLKTGPDVRARIDPDSAQLAGALMSKGFQTLYDIVFSSHALEHMPSPIGRTIRYWLAFVRPGGRIMLWLPNERLYVYDKRSPRTRNPAHAHYLVPEVVRWHLEQTLPEVYIEEETGPNAYCFLAHGKTE